MSYDVRITIYDFIYDVRFTINRKKSGVLPVNRNS